MKHPARNFDLWLALVVAVSLRSRLADFPECSTPSGASASCFGELPVGCPFPEIADHVEEAIAIWTETLYRRGALKIILCKILPRKLTLPCVSHVTAIGREFVAPIRCRQGRRARRTPILLQLVSPCPPISRKLRHRGTRCGNAMIMEPGDRTPKSKGPAPIGAEFELPPVRQVGKVYRMISGLLSADRKIFVLTRNYFRD